jgi:hypothetical protein
MSKFLHIALWIVQLFLAAVLIWAASMKLFKPAAELGQMWPWTAEHPLLAKFTGVLDFLAALGLVLPTLLGIKRRLTFYTAIGLIALMVAAIVFHFSRGEGAGTVINFVFAAAAAFVAWGRSKTNN